MNTERMYTVILAPHVSEKSTIAGELNNQYTFKVAKDATKPEIKAAVEGLFNVVVAELQVLNVKGKTKRNNRGQTRRRPSWKKAYVRLEDGHEIDFAEIG
ncbi:MAG: 50S ribosomal protein L23 [Pseudomonadales bacterium]|nr:50S ribosomal protein L23 [Pseudomonadales bacterium]